MGNLAAGGIRAVASTTARIAAVVAGIGAGIAAFVAGIGAAVARITIPGVTPARASGASVRKIANGWRLGIGTRRLLSDAGIALIRRGQSTPEDACGRGGGRCRRDFVRRAFFLPMPVTLIW